MGVPVPPRCLLWIAALLTARALVARPLATTRRLAVAGKGRPPALECLSTRERSRLSDALDRLDHARSADSWTSIVDACLGAVNAVPRATPVDAAELRALGSSRAWEEDEALSTRFFDAKPCDAAVRALARAIDGTPRGAPPSPAHREAADAISASGRFALLPTESTDEVLDALDAAVASDDTMSRRRRALERVAEGRATTGADGLTDEPAAANDARAADAIAESLAEALAPAVLGLSRRDPRRGRGGDATPTQVLRPLGFPESPLGLWSLAAVESRAAAAIGRHWHLSDGLAPLFPPRLVGGGRDDPSARTRVTMGRVDAAAVVATSFDASRRRRGGDDAPHVRSPSELSTVAPRGVAAIHPEDHASQRRQRRSSSHSRR